MTVGTSCRLYAGSVHPDKERDRDAAFLDFFFFFSIACGAASMPQTA
jgi:hypothetical protein